MDRELGLGHSAPFLSTRDPWQPGFPGPLSLRSAASIPWDKATNISRRWKENGGGGGGEELRSIRPSLRPSSMGVPARFRAALSRD